MKMNKVSMNGRVAATLQLDVISQGSPGKQNQQDYRDSKIFK